MTKQKRATLPLMILLGAVMILVPIAAGSAGGSPESVRPEPADGSGEANDSAAGGGPHSVAAAEVLSQAEKSGSSRALFLLVLLVVASAATADVLSGELIRRRTVDGAGERLQATLHAQAHERTMS